MNITIADKVLWNGTKVTVLGFGAEQTVQIGYYNLIGEYVRYWVSRDALIITRDAAII